MQKQLALTIWPDRTTVSVIRRFVEETCEHVIADLDACSRVAMAVHELVENAAKYASAGPIDLRVRLDDGERPQVAVEVDNAATADAQAALRAAFAEMEMAGDPFAHYQALLRRAARRTEGSGLGLARVAFEGEMKVTAQLDGAMVRVRATAPLDRASFRS